MEQQDYLKKQIDQLGRILGKVFSDLLGLKNSGEINEIVESMDETLKNELDFDVQYLLDVPTDHFINLLTVERNVRADNLEKLAEIFLLIAEHRQTDSKKLHEKSLLLYTYLEKLEDIYNLNRKWRIDKLKKDWKSCNDCTVPNWSKIEKKNLFTAIKQNWMHFLKRTPFYVGNQWC